LSSDKEFGLKVLQLWWPDVTKLNDIFFEYAPVEKYTNDNSAFDVAFDVLSGQQRVLIGLECKYTDSFSQTPYKKISYELIFQKSSSFNTSYEQLTTPEFNQLFRNQLLAESLLQNKKYDIIRTGLFCYHEDKAALNTAMKFREKLNDKKSFEIITYQDFLEKIQKLDLTWEQREWTMLLWARYFGLILSENTLYQLRTLNIKKS
jgi:hypothetical protein